MSNKLVALVLMCGLVPLAPLRAQPAEDPAHNELRTFRQNVTAAVRSGDIEAQLEYAHPDVVVTWQNNEVVRGHDGLREFMRRTGTDAFRGYEVEPTPDELTILAGDDTGISFGRSVARYSVLGEEYDFENRWTATLVKENGQWLLAAYHVSLNALDNPILNAATSLLYWVGGAALVIGVVVGVLVGRRRKPSEAT